MHLEYQLHLHEICLSSSLVINFEGHKGGVDITVLCILFSVKLHNTHRPIFPFGQKTRIFHDGIIIEWPIKFTVTH
jgi:hypothetical protein